jgi:outer membrane protein assembly factor BamB
MSSQRFLVLCGLMLLSALVSLAARAETTGWRGDGTGQFPQAKPLSAWGPEKGVLWQTPLPAKSNASPVLAGGRLILTAEPFFLLALDAKDGKILWQADHDFLQTAKPEEAAKLKESMAQAAELDQARGALQRQQSDVRKALRGKPEDAELLGKDAALKAEVAALDAKLKALGGYRLPKTHDSNGYASSTPVSDGQRVFALFGNGVASGHTLDGQRLWLRLVEPPTHEWGHSASPLLAGGLLILQIQQLQALDPATGETKWRLPMAQRWGTAAVTRIGTTDVLVTADGQVVRATDGKVLAKGLGSLDYNGPLVQDGIAYFMQHGGKAWKLGMLDGDVLTPTALWTCTPKRDRYYSSPVLLDGLLYAINQSRTFSVIDAATGAVVKSLELSADLGKGTAYPSIVRAGELLLVGCETGMTLVIKPGREPEIIERNSVEPYRGTILPDGDRLYLRGFKQAWCFGPQAGQ